MFSITSKHSLAQVLQALKRWTFSRVELMGALDETWLQFLQKGTWSCETMAIPDRPFGSESEQRTLDADIVSLYSERDAAIQRYSKPSGLFGVNKCFSIFTVTSWSLWVWRCSQCPRWIKWAWPKWWRRHVTTSLSGESLTKHVSSNRPTPELEPHWAYPRTALRCCVQRSPWKSMHLPSVDELLMFSVFLMSKE